MAGFVRRAITQIRCAVPSSAGPRTVPRSHSAGPGGCRSPVLCDRAGAGRSRNPPRYRFTDLRDRADAARPICGTASILHIHSARPGRSAIPHLCSVVTRRSHIFTPRIKYIFVVANYEKKRVFFQIFFRPNTPGPVSSIVILLPTQHGPVLVLA